jgi:addiction module HigA family antidote
MYNPSHPGDVLREFLEGRKIGDVAAHIGVSRVMLSKILNRRAGVTAEMSLRLSTALRTSPSLWFDIQKNWEFAQARHKKLPRIERPDTAA